MKSAHTLELSRDSILAGAVQVAAARTPGLAPLLSETDFERSIADVLASREAAADVWVFAYGSLLWNPTIVHEASRVGCVQGWHRSFCLWTSLSRGSPEQPGLTLGLDQGGSCGGVIYRLPPSHVERELSILWRREMPDGAYAPRWVPVDTDAGVVPAIAFTIDRTHQRYAAKVDELELTRIIALAVGRMGRCSDYLLKTVEALAANGIRDEDIERLNERVQARLGRDVTAEQGPSS